MKNLIITEQERKQILLMHKGRYINEQSESKIMDGPNGDPYRYKKEGGKYFYAKKGTEKWTEQTDPNKIRAIQYRIFKDTPEQKQGITDSEADFMNNILEKHGLERTDKCKVTREDIKNHGTNKDHIMTLMMNCYDTFRDPLGDLNQDTPEETKEKYRKIQKAFAEVSENITSVAGVSSLYRKIMSSENK